MKNYCGHSRIPVGVTAAAIQEDIHEEILKKLHKNLIFYEITLEYDLFYNLLSKFDVRRFE